MIRKPFSASRNIACEWMLPCAHSTICRGHLRVDQIGRESDRDRQDDQDAADERNRFAHDPQDVGPALQVPVNEALHDEREERGEGR